MGKALGESLVRAARLEELGCHRLWFTEHHPGPGRRVELTAPPPGAGGDPDRADPHGRVPQRYLDRLRCGGAPMQPPDDVALDWSASERYRVEGMLEAAVVATAATACRQLRDVAGRLAPAEVMTMTDLPDADATLRSCTRLAEITAEITAGVAATART